MACRRAGRHVSQRAHPVGCGTADADVVGRGRRTAGRCEGPAGRAHVRRRMVAGQARRRARNAGGLSAFQRLEPSSTSISTCRPKFTEAKWVKSIEIRPGNRALVHHVLALLSCEARCHTHRRLREPIRRTSKLLTARTSGAAAAPRHRSEGHAAETHRHLRTRHESAESLPKERRSASTPAASSSCRCITPPTARPATDRTKIGITFCEGAGIARGAGLSISSTAR